MTRDYKRHGTTLLAALSILDGEGDRSLQAAPPTSIRLRITVERKVAGR
jgi:hypothetical protein